MLRPKPSFSKDLRGFHHLLRNPTKSSMAHYLHMSRRRNGRYSTGVRMSGYATKIRSFDWIAKPPHFVTNGTDSITAWSFAGRGPEGRPPFEFGFRPGTLSPV